MIATGSRAYEEFVDFLAAGSTPTEVIAFRPSETAQARVADLIAHEKTEVLPTDDKADDKAEWDLYFQIEHLMRLAKARARQSRPSSIHTK